MLKTKIYFVLENMIMKALNIKHNIYIYNV